VHLRLKHDFGAGLALLGEGQGRLGSSTRCSCGSMRSSGYRERSHRRILLHFFWGRTGLITSGAFSARPGPRACIAVQVHAITCLLGSAAILQGGGFKGGGLKGVGLKGSGGRREQTLVLCSLTIHARQGGLEGG